MIFATEAPRHWAQGLPVIPLWSREKRPSPNAWQTYSEKSVPDDVQQEWLAKYPNGNIGLALGPESGMCMIDIDTDDPKVLSVLQKILPPSPWERHGRKGFMLAYKFSGFKTFRIKAADGSMLVEGLSSRTQCVLPPSIHPDTGKPYEADTDICDPFVRAQLMPLPRDIEAIIRGALEDSGITLSLSGHTRVTEWVSRGARDVTMMKVAGHYAYAVQRGELPFKETIDRMVAWQATCVEKVAGDDIDLDKGIRRIAEWLIRSVIQHGKILPDGWDAGLTDEERTAFGFDLFKLEHTKWTFERLKDYIKVEFLTHEPGAYGRKLAVDYMLLRMAQSDLDRLDQEILLKYVCATGQMGFTMGTLRARMNQLRGNGIEGLNHAEIAKDVLKQVEEEGRIVFCSGRFWQWQGSHWDAVPDSDLLRRIAQDYGHMPLCRRQSDHLGVLRVMSTLAHVPDLCQNVTRGVNFANGYLTENLVLAEHHPDYGCTYTLPYPYDPTLVGRAVKFDEFLQSCWETDEDIEEKRKALQESIAVTLFGLAPKFQRVFCLHGPPKSGKSQILKIVSLLLPTEVVCAVAPDAWADKFLPAQLFGKLLNVAGELSSKRNIDGTRFKEIVTGEAITGQHKNQAPFKFSPRCAHWFATNHLPKTDDTSEGFTRRWLLVVFNKVVSDRDKVLDIGTLIAADEREAIAAWAVEAIHRLNRQKEYTLPASHQERVQELAKYNNSLRTFLLDSGKVLIEGASSQNSIPEMDLYNAYYTFAIGTGVARPVSLSSFRQKMRELGSELHFKVKISPTIHGGQDCSYERLMFVPTNLVRLRK